MLSLELNQILNTPKLPEYLTAVNQNLESVAKTASPALKRVLLQVVGAKSKRLRPALLFASAGGKISDDLVLAGSAIELVHLGSLIHDDIIDKANYRWGKPSVIQTDGPAMALLAGDYLLASASSTAAKISSPAAQLISETIGSLINGESLEAGDDFNLYRSERSYFECVDAKTAALISASCRLGAICAKLDQPQIEALATYGKNLGVSFQLIDDLLDVLSSSKLMGKPTGQDAKNGIYTLPVIYSLHSGSARKLKKLFKDLKHSPEELSELLLADGSIQKVLDLIKQYNSAAQDCLEEFDNRSGLQGLPDAYLNWALDNLILAEYRAKMV